MPHRFASSLGKRLVKGAVAWALLKPGTRPRRVARRTIKAIAYRILANPHVSAQIKRVLFRFPNLNSRLRSIVRNERLRDFKSGRTLDTAAQSQNVRVVYGRLQQARGHVP